MKKIFSMDLPGTSQEYVIAILFLVIVFSAVMAGGLFPSLNKHPLNPQAVTVTSADASLETNSLHLTNLQFVPNPSQQGRDECLNKTAVLMLVDESSSLNYLHETDDLKTALKEFLPNLNPSTLVGLYVFSWPQHGDPRELVPLGTYQDNKDALFNQIDALDPSGDTYMKDGFILIKEKLDAAKTQYPDHSFFVVFFSDGLPDPASQNPEAIAEEIKNPPYNTAIFSIALDQADNQIMENIASAPKSTYFLESPTAADLRGAFRAIGQRICS